MGRYKMTDYDKDMLPVEEKPVYCSCGEEIYKDDECKECKKIRLEDREYYKSLNENVMENLKQVVIQETYNAGYLKHKDYKKLMKEKRTEKAKK